MGQAHDAQLATLSDEFHAVSCDIQPLWASSLGVPGLDDRLGELTEESEAAHASRLRGILNRTEALDATALDDTDRVTRAVLLHQGNALLARLEDGIADLEVSGFTSPVSQLFSVLPKAQRLDAHLERLRQASGFIDQFAQRSTSATRKGRGPHARGIQNNVEQLESYLSMPLDQDPFIAPTVGTPEFDEAYELVADGVRPAMQRLLDDLNGPIKDGSRSDEHCGLVNTTDGEAVYRRALAGHTTVSRTPEEVHQLGLDIVASLREEYALLGQSVFGTSDFAQVVERLRNDTGLRYETPQQMVTDARNNLVRAEQVIPDFFGTYHRQKCEVEPMNDLEAPTAVLGYYMPGSHDGSRPGRHWINTWQPHTRTRWEYETLAFHESVPGHHLQFAVGQEITDIPDFRRFGYVTAFGEGWGLYTERLCDEMGLYSSDLTRFGMASFDSWRACRLVVDTGMHYYGWSRQRAIDFMWDNSALTMENIVNEVDRYITWPGQACAYMSGRLEIDALRREAKERQGSAFEISAFHDAVLLNGSIPLAVLRDEVTRKLAA